MLTPEQRYQKKWYAANAEKRRKYNAEYQAANRERLKIARKVWRENNVERIRKNQVKWYRKNKKRIQKARSTPEYRALTRSTALYKKYKLTLEDWEALFASQDRKCAACKSDVPHYKHGWHVDHCHTGGHIRGILCHPCNTAIGLMKECPDKLIALACYVEGFQQCPS